MCITVALGLEAPFSHFQSRWIHGMCLLRFVCFVLCFIINRHDLSLGGSPFYYGSTNCRALIDVSRGTDPPVLVMFKVRSQLTLTSIAVGYHLDLVIMNLVECLRVCLLPHQVNIPVLLTENGCSREFRLVPLECPREVISLFNCMQILFNVLVVRALLRGARLDVG